jgi:zinc finger SWIM domain-containing protein 3
MYKKKELWAAAFLADGFWLGMKSNQRSESLNSCLHLHLDYGMTLVDLIVHYENAIVRLRESEARDDCAASQTRPVMVTKWQEIEEAMADTFTPAVFYLLQEELSKIDGIEMVEKILGTEDSVRYLVAWKNKRHNRFYVDYTPSNPEESMECSCRRMVRRGIPCKHILFVLNELKLHHLPKCIVLPRFSKEARRGLPARRTSDLFGWGFSSAEERQRYTELMVLASEALHLASNNPVLHAEIKAYLQDIISKAPPCDTPRRVRRKSGVSDGEQDGTKLPAIGDPEKVKTKGSQKENKKKRKNGVETKNGRPLDFSEKKRKLTVCSSCKKPGHNKRSIKCPNHPK